jgi:hypothetical protein
MRPLGAMRYYYHISAEESVPGSLSLLLGLSEENLIEIFKICGFYNNNNNNSSSNKRSAFLLTVFQTWVAASFNFGDSGRPYQEEDSYQDWYRGIPQAACNSISRKAGASNTK